MTNAVQLAPRPICAVADTDHLLAALATARQENDQLRARVAERDRELRTDDLTGLPNRRRFHEEIASRREGRKPWSLAMLDLDRFKPINDQFGHDAGDAVLTEVARRLAHSIGEHGLPARLHGDEFALVFPFPAAASALLVQRAMSLVALPMRLPSGVRISVRISAGIVDDDPRLLLGELMKRADAALYAAKPLDQPLVWTGAVVVPMLATTDRRAVRGGAFDLTHTIRAARSAA